jgi:H(+)-translocating pyrophosphatase
LGLGYSHYIIFGFSAVAIIWGIIKASQVNSIQLDESKIKPDVDEKDADQETFNKRRAESFELMTITNAHVKAGAKSFLAKEYTMLAIFCALFATILLCCVDMPWKKDNLYPAFPYTSFCFLVGASTSMLAGYLGMMIATSANVKVTYLCNFDIDQGFDCAYNGGQVLGITLVGLALLILEILIISMKPAILQHTCKDDCSIEQLKRQTQVLFEMISGYGLGGSTVALFGRVGGGIYTKAADVGSDLAGKVLNNIEEYSPLNPGTIADNVGDNVGDIAGMGADLFGSLAESTCAALVVSATSWELLSTEGAVYFPMMVTSVGIGASIITVLLVNVGGMKTEPKLRTQLILSTVLMSICIVPLLWTIPEQLNMSFANQTYPAKRWELFGCIMMGLWSGLAIGLSTEYYTSHSFAPVRELAVACLFDAATNIIKGLALGYMSNVIPICCLAATVLLSFHWAAMYGVALAALGMLGCLPVCLSVDGYGPISDNAGGIAEMCNLEEGVRERTDELDAAGNTTAAIGKGFAIGSACLVALALFGAFITRVADTFPDAYNVNILEPYTFAGLLFGAMLPYAFSALTMKAVG